MIQAHGENRFHTRPYARADPTCVSATFSAALQAMGVGSGSSSSEVAASLAKTSQPFQQTQGEVGVDLPKSLQTYHQEVGVFPPTTSPRHQGYRDGSYPQVNPGPSPPRSAPHDSSTSTTSTTGYLTSRYNPHDIKTVHNTQSSLNLDLTPPPPPPHSRHTTTTTLTLTQPVENQQKHHHPSQSYL